MLTRTDIKTVRKLPSEPSRLSVPVTVRLCWTAQATAAGHQGHCGRYKPQSHGPSLRQREVGAEAGAIRVQELAGAVARARGQSARRSVRKIRSLERADTQHEICSRGHAVKKTITVNGARYGGLHEYHQISGGYCLMMLLFAQVRQREQYKVVLLKMLPSGVRLVPPCASCSLNKKGTSVKSSPF